MSLLEIDKVIATGSGDVHCYVFPDDSSRWLLGAREVLYEGIPVITTNGPFDTGLAAM